MALLQSGKIFYIKCGLKDCEDKITISSLNDYYSWFMQQFSETLNITDSEYSTIKYAKDEYGDTVAYFLLPYINKNTEEKLILVFRKASLTLGIAKFYNNLINYINEADFKNYFICKVEDKEVESGEFQYLSNYCTLIINTNFLNTHSFYTIGFATSNKKILESYVTPNFFVFDAINKINNDHTDGIFYLNENIFYGDNKYPDFNNNFQKVRFASPSIDVLLADYNGGTGFYPQVFTNEEDAFSVVKIHFGQFRPAKDIYLTRVTTSTLADFCYYENMSEEKNSWKEIERIDFFGGKRNFLLGLNSTSSEDKSPNNEWIPVIEAVKEPFALKFSSDEKFTLSVKVPKWDGVMEYSRDRGKTWVIWHGEELSGDAKNSIYLRGSNNTRLSVSYNDSDSLNAYFNFTGKYAKGNIEYLLDYKTVLEGKHPTMADYCFLRTFYQCSSLIEAPDLPATQLSVCCYGDLFNGCTSLKVAPELPATELKQECYRSTFNGCTSLVKAPKLPATYAPLGCYMTMFWECTSLKEPPALPATNLAQQCYQSMFWGCTSLEKLPKLPATSIPVYAYYAMFNLCSKIKVSTYKDNQYKYPYRIPVSGSGYAPDRPYPFIFSGTGGSFKGNPVLNQTYYTTEEPV